MLGACAGDSSELESLTAAGPAVTGSPATSSSPTSPLEESPPDELAFTDFEPLAVVDATTGQCFDEAADLGAISQLAVVTEVSCAAPHDYEVFADFAVDIDGDAPFPGSSPIQDEAAATCPVSFEAYTGRAYNRAGPELYAAMWPTEESWNTADDRTILCVAFAVDGSKLEGSIAAD